MCSNPRTILYFGLSWGVQAGRLAPGLENPILEAGPNYYISLYAPCIARTLFGSGGYGSSLAGSGLGRAWVWAAPPVLEPGFPWTWGLACVCVCAWPWAWLWACIWPWLWMLALDSLRDKGCLAVLEHFLIFPHFYPWWGLCIAMLWNH